VWRDEAAFRAWTESEAFQKAHRQGRSTAGTVLGPPSFVGWQVVL
jgi:heme-degrading monooxygenase HmoA